MLKADKTRPDIVAAEIHNYAMHPRITRGDAVLVSPAPVPLEDVADGNICVVRFIAEHDQAPKQEYVLRRVYRTIADDIRLVADNQIFPEIRLPADYVELLPVHLILR